MPVGLSFLQDPEGYKSRLDSGLDAAFGPIQPVVDKAKDYGQKIMYGPEKNQDTGRPGKIGAWQRGLLAGALEGAASIPSVADVATLGTSKLASSTGRGVSAAARLARGADAGATAVGLGESLAAALEGDYAKAGAGAVVGALGAAGPTNRAMYPDLPDSHRVGAFGLAGDPNKYNLRTENVLKEVSNNPDFQNLDALTKDFDADLNYSIQKDIRQDPESYGNWREAQDRTTNSKFGGMVHDLDGPSAFGVSDMIGDNYWQFPFVHATESGPHSFYDSLAETGVHERAHLTSGATHAGGVQRPAEGPKAQFNSPPGTAQAKFDKVHNLFQSSGPVQDSAARFANFGQENIGPGLPAYLRDAAHRSYEQPSIPETLARILEDYR